MNTYPLKHYYLFKGDWYEKFVEVMDVVEKNQQQRFAIWEHADKKREHNLIIVDETSLPEDYCLANRIWKTDENIFDSYFKDQVNKFNIHANYDSVTEIDDPNHSFHIEEF